MADSLIGFLLLGFTASKKRKAISRSKHYLFDLGVTRFLAKTGTIAPKSKAFGDAFEHFVILEVRAYLSYARIRLPMCYWRSTSQFEVDLIIGNALAIEIKASDNPTSRDLKGLRALKEEGLIDRFMLVCTETHARTSEDGIAILPWQDFVKKLWAGELIGNPAMGEGPSGRA